MTGVSRNTGGALPDDDGASHIRQSIGDILTTPLGSRVMRRDYGSTLPELIDQPMNPATRLQLFAATALAVLRHEPRARLNRVTLDADAGGRAVLRLELRRVDRPRSPALNLFQPLIPSTA